MPPKKTFAAAPADEHSGNTLGIESFELPKNTLMRLARGAMPDNAKMAKEVPLAMSKASTVFVGYLAGIAHDVADDRQQKTIAAAHVLEAVKLLGWPDNQELHQFLKEKQAAYREANTSKKPLPSHGGGATSSGSAAAPIERPIDEEQQGMGNGIEHDTEMQDISALQEDGEHDGQGDSPGGDLGDEEIDDGDDDGGDDDGGDDDIDQGIADDDEGTEENIDAPVVGSET